MFEPPTKILIIIEPQTWHFFGPRIGGKCCWHVFLYAIRSSKETEAISQKKIHKQCEMVIIDHSLLQPLLTK